MTMMEARVKMGIGHSEGKAHINITDLGMITVNASDPRIQGVEFNKFGWGDIEIDRDSFIAELNAERDAHAATAPARRASGDQMVADLSRPE